MGTSSSSYELNLIAHTRTSSHHLFKLSNTGTDVLFRL